MVLGRVLALWDTTQSTIGNVRPAGSDSETGHDKLHRIEYQREQVFRTPAHTSRMIVDQPAPLLPKDSKEVNAQVKRIQAMLDAAIVEDPVPERRDRRWGQDPNHCQSLHRDSASSITPLEECDQGRDKQDLCDITHNRDARGWIKNWHQEWDHAEHEWREERDRDYYGPYYDDPHWQHSPVGGCNEGGVRAFSHDLKRVRWPLNFKLSGIEKYGGSTNPAEWLEVYQLTIEVAGGDSYMMANYLLVYLSSPARTWLLELPIGSVHSWSHLCRLFTNNFWNTCAHPSVEWDLADVVQKTGESLREFIQRFCNKRNVIPEVDDKSIIMLFKKGLRDSSLIHKLTMKNPKTSEEMLAIANKYALAEEAALDTREQKKKKESWHTDQCSSSKGHDKKRKVDCSVNNVEWPHRNKKYWPRPGEFEGFLYRICIFHPQGKHRTRDYNRLQRSTDEVLKTTKKVDQEKKPKDPKGDFPKAHKEVNYIYGGPNSYESRRKQKLTAQEVMAVSPATPEYLKWSEVPITFDRSDHPNSVPKLGRYPLIVSPIVKDVKLNRVLVDGGSSLNILFVKTFDQMGLSRSALHPSWAPFHDIVPGVAATPIGQITLIVTFGT
jgi:hypothetical protein